MVRVRTPGGAPRRARVASSSRSRPLHPQKEVGCRCVLSVERLEGRTLLATFVVIDAGDAGPGTLRQAILDANTLTGADTINFNIPGTDSVRTIRPLSALPEVTGQTTIDRRSQ